MRKINVLRTCVLVKIYLALESDRTGPTPRLLTTVIARSAHGCEACERSCSDLTTVFVKLCRYIEIFKSTRRELQDALYESGGGYGRGGRRPGPYDRPMRGSRGGRGAGRFMGRAGRTYEYDDGGEFVFTVEPAA